MIFAGIDAGSRAVKVAVVDRAGALLGSALADQGVDQPAIAADLLARVVADAGKGQPSSILATGYGRARISADARVTEITCHARGVRHLVPAARTIVEVGGQDSKVIWLSERGEAFDFEMNDRCAAGTGRFLELLAGRLGVAMDSFGALADSADQAAELSSTCAVFAESEVVGLLADGASPAEIAAGARSALARRIAAMVAGRVEPPVVLTGGGGLLAGLAEKLSTVLGCDVSICPHCQFTGAFGAALLAAERPE